MENYLTEPLLVRNEAGEGGPTGEGAEPEATQQEINVVVPLEEKPAVAATGNVGEPSEGDLDAFAEARLRMKGYKVERTVQQTEECWPGTDLPKSECPEYDELTYGEQAAVRFAWKAAMKAAQNAEHSSQALTAPMRRQVAIAEISEGLTPQEKKGLMKAIEEMEKESGHTFAPQAVTANLKRDWRRIAKGAASEFPKDSPQVGKEPAATAAGIELTEVEREIMEDAKRMGIDYTPEKVRALVKSGFSTSGHIMGDK